MNKDPFFSQCIIRQKLMPVSTPPSKALRFLQGYAPALQAQAQRLLDESRLGAFLKQRYPQAHAVASEAALYAYGQELKNRYLRSSPPVSKIIYDDNLHLIEHALGMHHQISRVQGSRLKAKNEIRISSLFRNTPEAFLRMIVVHELAHLREKDHNKAFYKLCEYMESHYHQLELDVRLYLCHRECFGALW